MSETREPTAFYRLRHTPMRDLLRMRVTGRLDWRSTVREAELPVQVKALLTKLVRKTRLWRLEKADVVTELIAHFEDAIAAGWTCEQAAEAFGDWRKAAKLIRRAKKRNRPRVWHVSVWCLRGIGLLLLSYIGLGFYYMIGERNVVVDYSTYWNELALDVPETDRAWPDFRDAMLVFEADPQYRAEIEGARPFPTDE